jgi:hypothetical protein
MEVRPNSKLKCRACRPRFLLQSSNADAEAFRDGVLFSSANTGSASDTQSASVSSLQGGSAGSGQRGGGASGRMPQVHVGHHQCQIPIC